MIAKFFAWLVRTIIKLIITALQIYPGLIVAMIIGFVGASMIIMDGDSVEDEDVKKWAYFWLYPFCLK